MQVQRNNGAFVCSSGGSFEKGDIRWFSDGQLNVCYNCVDRHVIAGRGDTVAIIFEGDEPGTGTKFTYNQVRHGANAGAMCKSNRLYLQVLAEVCRVANVLSYHGVRKGDTVA